MALPNNQITKKKIFDLMLIECTLSNKPFTYFNITPYYENDQWYVHVRYALTRELYKVIEENGLMNFKLIETEIF